MLSRRQWKACCFLTVIICGLWMAWGSWHHVEAYNELHDSYKAEQQIVDQMEQVIVTKNLEIDGLKAQIKELKEVK